MFRSKTVFVLGAGASQEVGLPVGEELKKKIAQKIDIKFDDFGHRQTSGDHKIMDALWEHTKFPDGRRGDPNPHLHMSWKLSEALPLEISIDNLLDKHRGDKIAETCGKLGIVSSILEAEKASRLHYQPTNERKLNFSALSNTWFAGFVKILTEKVAKTEVGSLFDKVTFLSFNYDRCIEHFLHEALQVSYSLDAATITNLMKNLQILHPYGSVGKLPWQETNQLLNVPFGSDRSNLLAIAKQIKTFNESVHEDQEIKKIRDTIQNAEIIVFLGFAFHRQNIELISPPGECKAKRIYATAYGISKSGCDVIQGELESMLKQKKSKASIEFRNDLKCAGLFDEYWHSLTADL